MDDKTAQILEDADWEQLVPGLLDYADWILRRYRWRGLKVTVGRKNQLLANSWDAKDFVQEAIKRTLQEIRAYNHELTLEKNIQRIIDSLISSWKKTSDRQPLVDHSRETAAEAEFVNDIDAAIDERDLVNSEPCRQEEIGYQKAMLERFEASVIGDEELLQVISAYKEDFYKPSEIEELTRIPAKRVYELKRKLADKFVKFAATYPHAKEIDLPNPNETRRV